METVVVEVKDGEYLQYWISSPSAQLRFSLVDADTHEIILSEHEPPALSNPPTFTRLWPLVGDRPQRESSLLLSLSFLEPSQSYRLKVLRRKLDGHWASDIDVEFTATDAGEHVLYPFKVQAQ